MANTEIPVDSCKSINYTDNGGAFFMVIDISGLNDSCEILLPTNLKNSKLIVTSKKEITSHQFNKFSELITPYLPAINSLEVNVYDQELRNNVLLLFAGRSLDRIILSVNDSLSLDESIVKIAYVDRLDILSDSLIYIHENIALFNGLNDLYIESICNQDFSNEIFKIQTLKELSIVLTNCAVNYNLNEIVKSNHPIHLKSFELAAPTSEINLNLSIIDTVDVILFTVDSLLNFPSFFVGKTVFSKIIIKYALNDMGKVSSKIKELKGVESIYIGPIDNNSHPDKKSKRITKSLQRYFPEAQIVVMGIK